MRRDLERDGPGPRLVEVQHTAVLRAMHGIAPRDPVAGMLAAQMVATHDAAMACHRRAGLPGQSLEGRDMALRHAGKLVRSCAALVEALGRHRGKGQQTVRVGHVHVHADGRAIVGAVKPRGVGMVEEPSVNPIQGKPWPMHGSPRCGARTRGGNPCRSPAVNGRQWAKQMNKAEKNETSGNDGDAVEVPPSGASYEGE